MNNLIQWPRAKYWDRAWNPVIGCKPCSPACEHCYAAAWAKRFGQSFEPHESSQERPPREGVVFCGNMTDLFGEWNDSPIDTIAKTAKDNNKSATFLYLTKRPHRMVPNLGALAMGWPFTNPWIFANHYFGFTAENQEWYDRRIKVFREDIPSWVNGWLSAEPLLGPINLLSYYLNEDQLPFSDPIPFKWVVIGCESGPNCRPCKIEWVEGIVEQCQSAGVPVFVKQLDLGGKCVTDIGKFPEHLRIRQVPWATGEKP